ncbi:methylated-DNA--[protein]-cysteine S-methyltransferase [Chitinibacter sp. SCUT-21]|uniref:methylated-DNA--[protein]-cysteine S-methyltransferase n=1 Tax=Chitinibacter sp. SCUT-21 TaxID=2970891 RepID=UPI0035A615C7
MTTLTTMHINLPFGGVELIATDATLLRLDFLGHLVPELTCVHPLLAEAKKQLLAYCNNPRFTFDLPYSLEGTPHQQKVWQQIARIESGQTLRYLDIASIIRSSPRAVGGACGRNPLPIIVPCHRVLAANGLGGFNANRNGIDWMPIKRWLLAHEGIISSNLIK